MSSAPTPKDPEAAQPVVAHSARADIVALLCAYVSESLRATELWAAEHGIHDTDIRAMAALGEATRTGTTMTAGQLGAAVGLSSPATSALIRRLEDAGHVTRVRDPQDRRRVLLQASPSALKGAEAYFRPMGRAVTAALAVCDPADTDAVARFLQQLVTHMRSAPPT
ncbi:MAG: MarR family transcriptional regulator [Coriobacteriales bacterium]|nr:MarR family transcriptional regulator [Actinomycetes bacterium]